MIGATAIGPRPGRGGALLLSQGQTTQQWQHLPWTVISTRPGGAGHSYDRGEETEMTFVWLIAHNPWC
jgi:hypothetical protein